MNNKNNLSRKPAQFSKRDSSNHFLPHGKSIISWLLILSIGFAFGLFTAVKLDIYPFAHSQDVKQNTSSSREGFKFEDAVIKVADTTGKAVVSISSEHTEKIPGARKFYFNTPGGAGFGEDEILRRFFDNFFEDIPDREFKKIGLGSGVIIDKAGYILTNEHVISEAEKITVTLGDGREFNAEVKGIDLRSDLAVIKINADNLTAAPFGNSDNLKIGQWVIAIGNPFGYAMQNPEATVTAGVISALHRSLRNIDFQGRDYSDLIQTDAAINPGNSGGPLVNLKGEIIGINVAIFSTTGGYQGLGFAIPVNNAKRVVSRLIEGKKIVYGWLGINVQDLSDNLKEYFGLPDKNGALIAKVLENSPAEKAGLQEGDVIKEFGSKKINNIKELIETVGKTETDSKIKVSFIREKKLLSANIVVEERPGDIDARPAKTKITEKETNWRGITAGNLDAKTARRFGIEEKTGVIVVDIEPNSPADAAGIIPGDVIIEINKIHIHDVLEYKNIVEDLTGDCLIRANRGYFLIKDTQ